MAVTRKGRAAETRAFGDYLSVERHRIFDRAGKERKEQMRAAEKTREVYQAWNKVLEGTRESAHVTGLKYLASSNELLVYLDSSAWTQELMLMREIIRTRMGNEGVALDALRFRTSPEGYTPKRRKTYVPAAPAAPKKPDYELSEQEMRDIDESVADISDKKLREALKNAMKASAQLTGSKQTEK